MPVRIQRKRTKGWRMPEGAVSVTRPGRFGNPYPVEKFGLELSLKLFANTARGIWSPSLLKHCSDERVAWAYKQHQRFMQRLGNHPIEHIWAYLRGRDLACFCSLNQPCHADVLLEIANS